MLLGFGAAGPFRTSAPPLCALALVLGPPVEVPDMRGWFPDASCVRTWGWGEACHSGSLSDPEITQGEIPPLSPPDPESWLCFRPGEEPALGSSSLSSSSSYSS